MRINSIGLGNYRSIGEERVRIDLARKATVLVGANSSGKSNVLHGLQWLQRYAENSQQPEAIDRHNRDGKTRVLIELTGTLDANEVRGLREERDFEIGASIDANNSIDWIAGPFEDQALISRLLEHHHGERFIGSTTPEQLSAAAKRVVPILWKQALSSLPSIELLPQFRRIRQAGGYLVDGAGMVEHLAAWQHPELGKEDQRLKFVDLEALLKRLLHDESISIEVPHDKQQILVNSRSLRLPLERHGTGVHQLIIMACAVLSSEDSLYCIEEPEVHLHPRLQREWLRFLVEKTKNQYLITTHSSGLIGESEEVAAIHLRLENGATVARDIATDANALEAIRDLGARASDIVQANTVVWVEGPSDRIYIRHWICLLAPELRENIDYSIMFYGGRLLAHVSMAEYQESEPLHSEQKAASLIALLRLNQNSAVVIDSDKHHDGSKLNPTKERVAEEARKRNLPCLVTWGREIENYLTNSAISDAYEEVTGESVAVELERYDRLEEVVESAFGERWKKSWSYKRDKPTFAHLIAPKLTSDDISEHLVEDLTPIIGMIKRARE